MTNPSPDGQPEPSPEPTEGTEPAAAAPATVDWQAKATEFQNRFAGSQRSLTDTQKERDALKAERDALAQFKAQAERANMTEIEALKADLAARDAALATARAEAERERLARKFPQTAAVLGDRMPTDEEALAALEQRLVAASGAQSEPEPPIDPNNPRKQPAPAPDPMDAVDAWMRGTFTG